MSDIEFEGDEKYIVFKRDEFDSWKENWYATEPFKELPSPVYDAIVIRRQDEIAPPVLDLYAGVYTVISDILKRHGEDAEALRIRGTADYFHQQAVLSWDQVRKLPD